MVRLNGGAGDLQFATRPAKCVHGTKDEAFARTWDAPRG